MKKERDEKEEKEAIETIPKLNYSILSQLYLISYLN